MILKELEKAKLISPPGFVTGSTQYLVRMGSDAYGCSNTESDLDLYGFCIPPKEDVFPHLKGEIQGFGNQIQRYEQYQQHHIKHKEKEYDLTVFSIIKYFQLVMENNPNMLDSLYVPQRCVIHLTQVGELVRSNRKIFLHKGCKFKFLGYSYSQKNKLKTKNPTGKRKELIEEYKYDVKNAYHAIRLLLEGEMILSEGDLDLERNRELLKSIRRGEWSIEKIDEFYDLKERNLEDLYAKSILPAKPDEDKIKELLLNCLEQFYGSLDKCIVQTNVHEKAIRDIKEILRKIE